VKSRNSTSRSPATSLVDGFAGSYAEEVGLTGWLTRWLLVAPAVCAACSTPPINGPRFLPNGVPSTAVCSGEGGSCLFGTAAAVGFASVPVLTANLYRVFPSGSPGDVQEQLVATQLVALDGTWAFNGREAWDHYYVQLVAAVQAVSSAAPQQVSTLVGPLTAPSSQGVALQIGPVFASVLQSNAGGAGQEINEVSAQLYDSVTGAVVTDASVSVVVGDASVPLTWSPAADVPSYRATFDAGVPAQPTYAFSSPNWDGAVELVAPSAAAVGTITAPAAGASIAGDSAAALSIDWASAQASDFEVVELYVESDGGWEPLYPSLPAISPDTQNTGPLSNAGIDLDAGEYLVNVAWVRAACAANGSGCVQVGSIASEGFDVTP
jgi:hypothetical protein